MVDIPPSMIGYSFLVTVSVSSTCTAFLNAHASSRRGKDGRTLIMPMRYLNKASVKRASIEDYWPGAGGMLGFERHRYAIA